MNIDAEYPIKERKSTGGQPLELVFSQTTFFGNHDCNTGGEAIIRAIDRTGKFLIFDVRSGGWEMVAPGIEFKSGTEYYGSSRTTRCCVRIQPSACPVALQIRYFTEYTTSDYPHEMTTGENLYTIMVED